MGTVRSVGPRGARTDGAVAAMNARLDALPVGARLPSVRTLAAELGIAKNTAVAAYERLVASGRVESRPGAGFFRAGARPAVPPASPPPPVGAVDSVWLLREQLDPHYAVRVGDGRPPPAWMGGSDIGRLLGAASRRGRALVESYGNPLGFPPLRQALAGTLAERQIRCGPDQVILTNGANHALDLIIRFFVRPGDAVLVDSPGYYPLFGKLHLAGARIVGVRRNPDGPDPDDLAAKAAANGAALFFTQSLAQNPTGCSLATPVAFRVLQAAAASGLRIVESDPFADLFPPNATRLAALDGLDRVIYVGTFAKTLSASLRTGFLAARPAEADALAALKMITAVNSSSFVERAVFDLIEAGHYRRHLRRLAGRVEVATEGARAVLARLGLPVFGDPWGGFYLWAGLPDGIDAADLSRRAARSGVLLAPGTVFDPDGSGPAAATRLNVAYFADGRFEAFWRDTVAGRQP